MTLSEMTHLHMRCGVSLRCPGVYEVLFNWIDWKPLTVADLIMIIIGIVGIYVAARWR